MPATQDQINAAAQAVLDATDALLSAMASGADQPTMTAAAQRVRDAQAALKALQQQP